MPQFVTDDGVKLVYDDLGPPDGAPVVLGHALAASAQHHIADAEFLAERGYRVLVPDARGHGRSGRPGRMTVDAFTIRRMADDLAQMLDMADVGPVHWVGNSMGGIVGLDLMGREPGRFRTFATFGTSYSFPLPRFLSYGIPWTHALMGQRRYSEFIAWAECADPAAQKLIAKIVAAWDPEIGRLVGHNLANYNLIPAAVGSHVPLLMLRGRRDPQVNVMMGSTLRAMRGRPNFTLVDMTTGHCANLDQPDAVRAELLGFWQRAADV